MQRPRYNISLNLPQEQWDKLTSLAQAQGTTNGRFVMVMLRELLEGVSLPNPNPSTIHSNEATS